MRQLSWLHVSDLHIKSEGDGFSQQEACSALTRHIADAGDSFPQIHFVLVTGGHCQVEAAGGRVDR